MSEKEVQVITLKQVRQQFNKLGFAFVFMLFVAIALKVGYPYLLPYLNSFYKTVDVPTFELLLKNGVILTIVFIPFLICARSLKINIREIFSPCHGNWKDIVQISFAIVGVNLLLTFLVGILSLILSYQNIQFSQTEIILDGNWMHMILLLINYVLITPFCEEFIFRGVSLRCFSKMGNYFAIFASALLFCLFQGNLPATISSFFLGLILAVFALRYNSILPTIFMHSAIKLFFVVMELVPAHYTWVTGLLCVVIYGITLLALNQFKHHKIIIPKENNGKLLWKEFFCSWSMICAILAFLVLKILNIGF